MRLVLASASLLDLRMESNRNGESLSARRAAFSVERNRTARTRYEKISVKTLGRN